MNSATFPAAAVEGLAHVEISTHVIGKELTSLLHHHLSLIAVEKDLIKNKYYSFHDRIFRPIVNSSGAYSFHDRIFRPIVNSSGAYLFSLFTTTDIF